MEIEMGDSVKHDHVFKAIQRKDLKGQSFAFSDFEAIWNPDFTERRITKINELYDVGPVTYPAYDDTSISARDRVTAMEAAAAEKRAAEEEAEQRAADEAAVLAANAKNQKKEFISMDPKQLRDKAQKSAKAAEDLQAKAKTEERELTAEEVAERDSHMEESKRCLREAKVQEELTELRKQLVKPEAAKVEADQPEQRHVAKPERKPITMPLQRNLVSFKADQFGSVSEANEAAYRSGRFLAAALYGHEESREWCRQNGMRVVIQKESRAAGINVNAKAGYLVPDEMETAIINVIDQFGVARQICRVHTMGSDTLVVPIRDGGLTAYAVGENSTITDSDKTWSNAELVARKWATLSKYSSEIAEDAIISMADDLTMEIGSAFAGSEDDSMLNGDGTSTYHNIVGIHTSIEADKWAACKLDAASGHDTLAEVDADDLALCYGKMLDKYRPGSVWLCNPFTKAAVFDSIMAAAGGNQNAQLAAGQPATYMGYPIITSEKMYGPATASTVANGLVPILFGRFDIGVSMGVRRGMTVAMSDQRYFELDQIAIRGTERFDIAAHNANPGDAVGPIVGLSLTT
jgi:HK97 family phage major capsid protein